MILEGILASLRQDPALGGSMVNQFLGEMKWRGMSYKTCLGEFLIWITHLSGILNDNRHNLHNQSVRGLQPSIDVNEINDIWHLIYTFLLVYSVPYQLILPMLVWLGSFCISTEKLLSSNILCKKEEKWNLMFNSCGLKLFQNISSPYFLTISILKAVAMHVYITEIWGSKSSYRVLMPNREP